MRERVRKKTHRTIYGNSFRTHPYIRAGWAPLTGTSTHTETLRLKYTALWCIHITKLKYTYIVTDMSNCCYHQIRMRKTLARSLALSFSHCKWVIPQTTTPKRRRFVCISQWSVLGYTVYTSLSHRIETAEKKTVLRTYARSTVVARKRSLKRTLACSLIRSHVRSFRSVSLLFLLLLGDVFAAFVLRIFFLFILTSQTPCDQFLNLNILWIDFYFGRLLDLDFA